MFFKNELRPIFKQMNIRLIILIILLLSYDQIVAQQKEYIFKNYTQEEGLPSNETYYIFEDSRHYLWIATDLGVVRFNGNKFELFNLPDNVIFKIKEDSKGRIWFFTHKAQLAYFENEKMYPYQYNENIARRITRINIVDAYVDEKENIYLSQSTDSNYTINTNGRIDAVYSRTDTTSPTEFTITLFNDINCFTHNTAGGIGLSNSFSIIIKNKQQQINYSILADHYPFHHYGSITLNGKDVYFFGGKTLIKLRSDGSFITKNLPGEILCLNIKGDNLWVGMMKSGVVCLSQGLILKKEDTLLQNKSITSINYDYEGGMYFSTLESGIYYLKNKNIRLLNNNSVDAEKSVTRLMNFTDSSLVYSNSGGIHFLRANKSTQLISLANSSINDLFVNNKHLYCLGGFFDIRSDIRKSKNKNFDLYYLLNSPSEAITLEKDSFICSTSTSVILYKSNFILSSQKSRLNYDSGYANNPDIIINKPLKLFKDKRNNIWGGGNDGLYKSTVSHDTMLQYKSSSLLLKRGIHCIREMEKKVLVLGIRFGGIALLLDTDTIINITEAEGLLSNKIKYLLPLKNDLWVATAKGISVIRFSSYNPIKYKIINIGKNDGFYNITINHLIQFQESIVAATSNGIYFIENYNEILNRKIPDIPFYLNNINSYKGDTSGINNITLPYSKNRIVLKYNAVCFNSPEEVKYNYRFQTDTNWNSTSNTELLLENLEPGLYNLQLKATIPNQNRSSSIINFNITVEKPWWQSNWFRLFVFLSIAGSTYLYVTHKIKKIRIKEKNKTDLNARIAELEQTALRSQMNPHFIFNCLTSIQQLIVTGNKTDANEYLVKFARLIRKTLDLSASPFISIREETEYLNEYIFLEQLRLSGQFDYTITTGSNIDLDKTKIPNMMIQPVVENCIRHGIKSLEDKKGKITIRFDKEDDKIICTVTDNGVGRSNSASFNKNAFTTHKSYGIDIIEKRLKTLSEFNQGDMGIEVKDLYNSDGTSAGTQVTIQLPFKIDV
jgi:ligand-binding sensor domain-containing protein